MSDYYRNRNFTAVQNNIFIGRLEQNSPFLLTRQMAYNHNWPMECERETGAPNLAMFSTQLYHCNLETIAKGMTQAIPIWKTVSLYALSNAVVFGLWVGLLLELFWGM